MMNDFWNKTGYDRLISTSISNDSNYTIIYHSCEDFGPNILHTATSISDSIEEPIHSMMS